MIGIYMDCEERNKMKGADGDSFTSPYINPFE